MQCAGGSFDWLEHILRGESDVAIHDQLIELASESPPGSRGLLFLPYLIGERSPHWNPRARGAFVGLTMVHGQSEMVRAVLEGVAMNLRTILDAFRDQGAAVKTLRLIGGGMRSGLWRQILADVLEVATLRPQLTVEATALGAAMAGAIGVGLLPDFASAADLVQVEPGEEPEATAAARYRDVYPIFHDTYLALAPIYDRIAAM
jgi:xylulokinase